VQVVADNDGSIRTSQFPIGAFLDCGVTTNHGRRLSGSLLALGDKPLPWS
jgi:hypothetical protein